MAVHEMRLILAKVLWAFDPQLCDEESNWLDQRVFITWEKMPLMVKLGLQRDDAHGLEKLSGTLGAGLQEGRR